MRTAARPSTSSSAPWSRSATRRRMAAERVDEPVERLDDGLGVVVADAGPDRGLPAAIRVMSRKPPAASLSSAARARPRDRRRGSSGWPPSGGARGRRPPPASRARSGSSATTSAPRSASTDAEARVGAGVGRRGRRQHPGRPDEEVRRGALDADLLGAGHRVPAHEERMVDRCDQRTLHAAHVGHDGARAGTDRRAPVRPPRRRRAPGSPPRPARPSGPRPPRRSRPSATARVATPGTTSIPVTCQPRRVRAIPTDPPIRPVPKIIARRRLARRAVLSRGGRHGVLGRPRGRRGGSRPGGDRW